MNAKILDSGGGTSIIRSNGAPPYLKDWRGTFIEWKCIINGFGALVTFVGSIVVFVMKFADGAWALLLVIPLIVLFMSYTHRHYYRFGKAISLEGYVYIDDPDA